MRLHTTTSDCPRQSHHSRTVESKQSGPITENEVEYAVVHFLRARGWIVERNQVGLLYTADGRPCPVGRKGQCDWRAMRPLPGAPGKAYYFEVELKRPGAKPTQVQREYMALRKHQGMAVTWADSLEAFAAWYGETFGVAEESL